MSQTIKLCNSGQVTHVDDDDYATFGHLTWRLHTRPDGYSRVVRSVKNKMLYLAREIMEHHLGRKLLPTELVDHINGNTLDNRKINLRIATRQENAFNARVSRSNNYSGYKGVSWFANRKKWVAQVTHNYKHITIGYYDTPEQAAIAYNERAKQLFGAFARTNTIPE